MAKHLILTAILLSTFNMAYGQIPEAEKGWGNLGVMWAIPEGEFADELDGNPIGASVLFGGQVLNSPLFLGTELGFLNYGINERLDLFHLEDVPVEVVNTSSSYNIVMGHLVARLQVPAGPVRPFVDVLGGIKYFVTGTNISSDVIIFREGLDGAASVKDWALSYGAGAGIDLRLFRGSFGWDNRAASVSLNAAVRYLLGTEANYVTSAAFNEDLGRFVFDVRQSETNMIIPQVGITLEM